MIVADSSVWIDYFSGKENDAVDKMDRALRSSPVLVGDLILTEVLQGFRNDRDFDTALVLFQDLGILSMLGQKVSVQAAKNFRSLRRRGITVRKTADVIIATYCIEKSLPLLYTDRDFDPFVAYLGLQQA